jgi:putative ABC transport system permease protein
LASVLGGLGGWAAAGLLGLVLVTGVLAGAYPALFVARQSPTRVLRGAHSVAGGRTSLRHALIVFQFVVSIALVAVTFVVLQQLDYVRTLPLGFDEERVVTIPASGARRSFEPLREALAAQPGVVGVSAVNGLPGTQDIEAGMVARRIGQDDGGTPVHAQSVGPGFFDLMDVAVRAGRVPTADPAGASREDRALLLNETAAAALGWGLDEAVGQRIRVVQPGNEANNPGFDGTVAGVVADFHHGSVRAPVPAAVYYPAQSADVPGLYVISHVLVKLAPPAPDVRRTGGGVGGSLFSLTEQIARLQATWEDVLPRHPFEASFLDTRIQAQYESDRRLARAVGLFAGLAVFIAGLGLFGLAAFAVEQRRREISIRRALGATAASVVGLLSKDMVRLVGLAFLVAVPVAYLAAQQWLADFAYRIDLGAGVFLGAGLLALAVALLAVGTQAWRAARQDPTTALRAE